MQTNNPSHHNKKIVLTIVLVFIVIAVASFWYFSILKRETPETGEKTSVPQEETEDTVEFSEFPEDVRPLLKDSLDEAIMDIKDLEL